MLWNMDESIRLCDTHTDIRRAVITDPSDPKFDLEAYLTQVQKDNP